LKFRTELIRIFFYCSACPRHPPPPSAPLQLLLPIPLDSPPAKPPSHAPPTRQPPKSGLTPEQVTPLFW
jgi:hypothetical protein